MQRAIYTRAAQKIAAIEAEMKAIGVWSAEPLPESAYRFQRAFAADTMSFTQWLQFILIPRVRTIIEQGEDFPQGSNIGAQATREFAGYDRAARLTTLVSEFDALFASK
ncbi:YqcC family protein [Hyalangium versicolor]|uniref:YqcC family protein n=1 Tax=Hyalangium versicolor TaxID=2861190 RepID=UPI001CCD457B|nr:YqcC family protein [Hyalangium versicolor]